MDQIIQPLRQYVIHIRSKDAQREGELNSHLFVDLAQPIKINPNDEEIHQIILSSEIPYSWYNVSSDILNNVINYEDESVSNVLFTFPNKDYDIDELVKVINADDDFPFSSSYDKYTMKLTLTNTSLITKTIRWDLSNASKIMGFNNTTTSIVSTGNSVESDNIIDLATIHSLFIKSNSSSNMVFSTRSGFSQTIQKVSVDVNSGNIIYLNQNDSRQHTILHSNIDALDIRITDQNDNNVNFNGINYEITIGFMIYPLNKIRPSTEVIQTTRRQQIAPQTANNLRPYTTSTQIRLDDAIDDINEIETDGEHQAKRLIIDEVLEKMSK